MKIELSHLAPYLPFKLKILREGKITELCGLEQPYKTNDNYYIRGETKVPNGTYRQLCSFLVNEKHLATFKPILRPLSDLPENGLYADKVLDGTASYAFMVFCFGNHFDVFGLIEQGLAININDL